MTTCSSILLETPASDTITLRETLARLEVHESVSDTEYVFVAYQETHRASGTWCVRINAHPLGGALFHPNAIRIQARAASAQGRRWFTWGKSLSPTADDPRKIEFRVHVCNGQATGIEIFVLLRAYDHSADEPHTIMVPWPAR